MVRIILQRVKKKTRYLTGKELENRIEQYFDTSNHIYPSDT